MVMSEMGKRGRNLKAPEINKDQLFPGFPSIATGRSKVHLCRETSLLLRDQALMRLKQLSTDIQGPQMMIAFPSHAYRRFAFVV